MTEKKYGVWMDVHRDNSGRTTMNGEYVSGSLEQCEGETALQDYIHARLEEGYEIDDEATEKAGYPVLRDTGSGWLYLVRIEAEGDYEDPEAGAVTTADHRQVDFEEATRLMDSDLREKLHMELAPCTDQEFFTAYETAHFEKFHEEFQV